MTEIHEKTCDRDMPGVAYDEHPSLKGLSSLTLMEIAQFAGARATLQLAASGKTVAKSLQEAFDGGPPEAKQGASLVNDGFGGFLVDAHASGSAASDARAVIHRDANSPTGFRGSVVPKSFQSATVLARIYNASPALLRYLSGLGNLERNPALPGFEQFEYSRYLGEIAGHRNIPLDVVRALVINDSSHVRSELAANPDIDINELSSLLSDPESVVRMKMARRRDVTLAMLQQFAQDSCPSVAMMVAGNPKANLELITAVFDKISCPDIKMSLAKDARLTDVTLQRRLLNAVNGKSHELALAENPSVSPEILLEIVQRNPEMLRSKLEKKSPPEVADWKRDRLRALRDTLIEHPNTPVALKSKLHAAKTQSRVRSAFSEMVNKTFSTLSTYFIKNNPET